MQNKVIINFLSTDEKKAQYTAACKDLGISISEVCRRALDNTIALSEKLKTPAPKHDYPACAKGTCDFEICACKCHIIQTNGTLD
jgi:hypothetical protein